jgi:hypothetical protein
MHHRWNFRFFAAVRIRSSIGDGNGRDSGIYAHRPRMVPGIYYFIL